MLEDRLHSLAEPVIRQTLRKLPEGIAAAAKACLIEPVLMSACLEAGEDIEDDLLGLFEGLSLADPEPEMPAHLPRIRLFLDNLWDFADGKADVFCAEVRVTLLHELGHYLGFDEEQISALGLE